MSDDPKNRVSEFGTHSSRVLAIFAHPDDESLVAGGTLAACTAAGLDVVLLSVTRGEQGPISHPGLATRETLGAVREAELTAAASALGIRTVVCLDHPDGELGWANEREIGLELVRHIRLWQPEAVITFGPEGLYWHPDHIAVHRHVMAAVDAIAAEDLSPWVYHATLPKGRMAELVSAMAIHDLPAGLWNLQPDDFGVPISSITTVIDVRPFVRAKLRALRCHRTQLDQDHVFQRIPDHLAEGFLGTEYFLRARQPQAAVDRLEQDWLTSLLKEDNSWHRDSQAGYPPDGVGKGVARGGTRLPARSS
jgi:LmbE family N-acetylglucosaminyl deacetylase